MSRLAKISNPADEKNARNFSIKGTVRKKDGRVKMNIHSSKIYNAAMTAVINMELSGDWLISLMGSKMERIFERNVFIMSVRFKQDLNARIDYKCCHQYFQVGVYRGRLEEYHPFSSDI